MDYKKACQILGVSLNASDEEKKRAFRKRLFEHHPDRGGSNKRVREILEAYRCCVGTDNMNIDALIDYVWRWINPVVQLIKEHALENYGQSIKRLTKKKAKDLLMANPKLREQILDTIESFKKGLGDK